MNTVCRIAVLGAVFAATSVIFAQSNDRLDELLAQAPARIDLTTYLLLAAGGHVEETASPDEAFSKAVAMGIVPKTVEPGASVRADELSYMIMKSLSLPGGVMYAILPGPRYAYREMTFRQVLSDSGGPARLVAGDEVVRALGYASALKGGAK